MFYFFPFICFSYFSDGPRQRRTVCNIPLFFIIFIRPLTDWSTQTVLYSHWSTHTECSMYQAATDEAVCLTVHMCRWSFHVLQMSLVKTGGNVNLISAISD